LAVPNGFMAHLDLLEKQLYLKKLGVNIGTIAKGSLIPHHELALSTNATYNAPKVALSLEQAQNYLRKHAFNFDVNKTGWVLATYKNANLGWLKVLQGRFNNYYPSSWRIQNK
jgi:NOL1/NOP2/fmu family ribosome biogenesis protein